MGLQRVVKAKNQRVKRVLQKREPKIHENDKNVIFIKGGKTSETVAGILKDLYMMKKPLSIQYKRKNIMRPFDDATSIEFFSNKSDASLFMFGSHSKKRPHNLIIGRLFHYQILDMIELGIENYKSLASFETGKVAFGTKPCLVFTGEAFDQDAEHKRLKNILLDFFVGGKATQVRLAGLEHVWNFTAVAGKIYWRSYKIQMKKSGSRVPRVELEEMGPSLDLVMRRTKLASDDLYKRARKQPYQAKPKKKKNVSMDKFGTQLGRIHMTKQDLDKLQTRKMKGLKRKSDGGDETSDKEEPSEKLPRESSDEDEN